MAPLKISGTNELIKQIGNLYLNEDFSDVTIVINDVELPAHRIILAQRCPYFKKRFTEGFPKSPTTRVTLRETSISGFKSTLSWMYTGIIKFKDVNDALEVLQLAHLYELTELEEETVKYLSSTLL